MADTLEQTVGLVARMVAQPWPGAVDERGAYFVALGLTEVSADLDDDYLPFGQLLTPVEGVSGVWQGLQGALSSIVLLVPADGGARERTQALTALAAATGAEPDDGVLRVGGYSVSVPEVSRGLSIVVGDAATMDLEREAEDEW